MLDDGYHASMFYLRRYRKTAKRNHAKPPNRRNSREEHQPMRTARRRRRVHSVTRQTKPRLSPSTVQRYQKYAEQLIATVEKIEADAEPMYLDSAVRDLLYMGLAYLLHVAYDNQAIALQLDGDAFHSFISGKTAQWFRDRGFADWFCSAAASGFNTSRPREPMAVLCPPPKKRKARNRKPKAVPFVGIVASDGGKAKFTDAPAKKRKARTHSTPKPQTKAEKSANIK